MKHFFALFLAAALLIPNLLPAYAVPNLSYPLHQRVLLLPKDANKEVSFTFVKFDANGRPGADVLAWLSRRNVPHCRPMIPQPRLPGKTKMRRREARFPA